MAGPSVIATVSAHDTASATLREFAALAKRLGGDLQKAVDVDGSKYVNSITRASSATREHIGQVNHLRTAWHGVSAAMSAVAASAVLRKAVSAVEHYVPIEKENRFIKAAGNYSDSEIAQLVRQQKSAAQIYGETNEATAESQKVFATRQISAPITEELTKWALITAKALGVSAKESATILEGAIFAKGQSPKTVEDAAAIGKRQADLAAVMSKAGAMSAEDISQYYKYAASITTAAGVDERTAAAVAMTLKRANIRGDEAGTFMRQLASRLMSPTAAGRQALTAAGIDYDTYAKAGSVGTDVIERTLKERYGKTLTEQQRTTLEERLDSDGIQSKGDFVKAVVDTLGNELGLKAQDRATLGKAMGKQWDLAREGLDGEGLLNSILTKMSPQQLLEYVGVRQGARGQVILGELEKFHDNIAAVNKGLDGEGRATQIARERMEGLGASTDRLRSTFDDAVNSLVRANEGWLTTTVNAGSKAIAYLDSFGDNAKIGVAAAAGATLASTLGMAGVAAWKFVASATAAARALQVIAATQGGTAAATAGVGAAAAAGAGAASRSGLMKKGLGLAGAAFAAYQIYDLFLSDIPWGNAITGEQRQPNERAEELRKRIAAAEGRGASGMARDRIQTWRDELDRLERAGSPWSAAPSAAGPNVIPQGWSTQGIGGFGPDIGAQQVQVSGEAEVVWNGRVEVGLKPEIIEMLNKAQMGLSSDAMLGRSMSGTNGVDRATPTTGVPQL